jgi:hypothetical protein
VSPIINPKKTNQAGSGGTKAMEITITTFRKLVNPKTIRMPKTAIHLERAGWATLIPSVLKPFNQTS